MAKKKKLEVEDTKKFVGPNGEFVSTYKLEEGKICIGYLEELLEWLFYHDNITDKLKLRQILAIEHMIQKLLNDYDSNMKINYVPTWSKKLKG